MVNDQALKVLIAFFIYFSFLCKTKNYVFFKVLLLLSVFACFVLKRERERERERENCLDEVSSLLF